MSAIVAGPLGFVQLLSDMVGVPRDLPSYGVPGTRPGRDYHSGAQDALDLGYRWSGSPRRRQAAAYPYVVGSLSLEPCDWIAAAGVGGPDQGLAVAVLGITRDPRS